MPHLLPLIFVGDVSPQSIAARVERPDGLFLDPADATFKPLGAIADPLIPLTPGLDRDGPRRVRRLV